MLHNEQGTQKSLLSIKYVSSIELANNEMAVNNCVN